MFKLVNERMIKSLFASSKNTKTHENQHQNITHIIRTDSFFG
jgi:hypothetical protein